MPIRLKYAVTTAIVVGIAGAGFAAGHLTEDQQRAMNARQGHMGLYSFNIAPLGGMAQDKIPYDAEVAATAAANLAALATLDQTAYWVEGTDSTVEGSRAKPEIWTDSAGYQTEKEKLETTTAALAAVAGDGLDALKGAFGPVGGSCGSCHEAYRVPQN